LGSAARQHALRHYTWDAKARKMLAVYEWVLGRGPDLIFGPESKLSTCSDLLTATLPCVRTTSTKELKNRAS